MTVMVANQSNARFHYWAGRYGYLGHICSPDGWRKPFPWLPYALDNGAFTAFKHRRPFDGDGFRAMLDLAAAQEQPPVWVLCPDVVGDRDGTLRAWDEWQPRLAGYGWPLAFAAQDGMVPGDVPLPEASVVFVGGSTAWKLATLRDWCRTFARVHVGRVNTEDRLWACRDAGAESVDGTGWWHERQAAQLERYLQFASGCGGRPADAQREMVFA